MTVLKAGELSRREQQLVELVRFGLTNKEIASRLNLSEFTVKNHLHRIFCKIGVHDRMTMVDRCQGNPEVRLQDRMQKLADPSAAFFADP
jgi:DNA-binding NarL/FixJ family response regulator